VEAPSAGFPAEGLGWGEEADGAAVTREGLGLSSRGDAVQPTRTSSSATVAHVDTLVGLVLGRRRIMATKLAGRSASGLAGSGNSAKV
jgi:hypothetical protein